MQLPISPTAALIFGCILVILFTIATAMLRHKLYINLYLLSRVSCSFIRLMLLRLWFRFLLLDQRCEFETDIAALIAFSLCNLICPDQVISVFLMQSPYQSLFFFALFMGTMIWSATQFHKAIQRSVVMFLPFPYCFPAHTITNSCLDYTMFLQVFQHSLTVLGILCYSVHTESLLRGCVLSQTHCTTWLSVFVSLCYRCCDRKLLWFAQKRVALLAGVFFYGTFQTRTVRIS